MCHWSTVFKPSGVGIRHIRYRVTICVRKTCCVERPFIARWGWSCVDVHREVFARVHIGVGAHRVVRHLVHIEVAKRGPRIGVRHRARLVDRPGVHWGCTLGPCHRGFTLGCAHWCLCSRGAHWGWLEGAHWGLCSRGCTLGLA